ncbi:unnamed protein product [Phytomonas sp. Hart1]|nr:unnamed protein product [Phytomonas sp. Hart1]|eukprot:CCW66356.1 unnamed protein product [Phytomonas sp. isolate Hart1]
MEISLALSSDTISDQPVTVDLDHPVEYSSSKYSVKESGSGFVCVHDYVKAVLLEVTKDCFTIVGVFFFRTSGSQHAFSLGTSQGIVDFEASLSPKTPSPSADLHIVLSTKHLIDKVEFFADTLLIGTINGSLGIVLFRDPKQVKGCFVERNTVYRGLHRWGFACESNLCAIASENNVAIFAYQRDQFEYKSDYRTEIEIGNISSILLLKQHSEVLLSILIHYTTSHDLTLLTLRLADCTTISRENISLVCYLRNSAYFFEPGPQSFTVGTHNAHIVVTLLPDYICFGTICEAKYEIYTSVPNDSNAPFEFGHWSKRCLCSSILIDKDYDSNFSFAALRSDCICVLYDLKTSGDKIKDIYLTHQIVLPFSGFCFSPFQGSNGILSIAHCDLVCSSFEYYRSVQVQRSFSDSFLPLRGMGFLKESSLILLLEVVQTGNYCAFVYLLKSGECLLAVYEIEGTKRVAFEENPCEVTSIFYFIKEETKNCVLGFNDGMVKIFTEGKFCAAVRTPHCGPIDRLSTLYNFHAYYAEAVFVSISSSMGTICFHSVETGEVSQTFVSPSRPLTSCYLDRSCEYLFAFSQLTGNLWHLQSCSLERTFVAVEKPDFQGNLSDLMAKTCTSSLRIKTLHFLGRRYFSIYINIERIIADMQSSENLLFKFPSATSLLLDCCVAMNETSSLLADNSLSNVLESISLKTSSSCDICLILGVMRLVYALFDSTKDAKTAYEAIKMSIQLHQNLSSKCSDESGSLLGNHICDYFFTFFINVRFVSAAARHGFQILARNLTPERILNLSQNLLNNKILIYHGTHGAATHKIPFSENEMYVLIGTLIVESEVQVAPKLACELQQRLVTPILDFLKEWLSSSKSETISFDLSMALLAFSEGFPIFTGVLGTSNLIFQLFEYAIKGGCEGSRSVCMRALSRIIAHNPVKFIEDYCVEFSAKHPRWNSALIKLFAFFVINFSCKAFYVCDYLLDFSIKLMGKSSVVDEKDVIMGAITQFVRTLTTFLPNISFQAHSQRIAVGTSEGVVRVYSLKTEGIVTSFNAHPEPVLCLAFSSNKTDYELVTVSKNMNGIKVWKTPPQSISLVNLFSRSPRKFELFSEVDLPVVQEFVTTELLLVQFCQIQWLSPECVQFVSPWHKKVIHTV